MNLIGLGCCPGLSKVNHGLDHLGPLDPYVPVRGPAKATGMWLQLRALGRGGAWVCFLTSCGVTLV